MSHWQSASRSDSNKSLRLFRGDIYRDGAVEAPIVSRLCIALTTYTELDLFKVARSDLFRHLKPHSDNNLLNQSHLMKYQYLASNHVFLSPSNKLAIIRKVNS